MLTAHVGKSVSDWALTMATRADRAAMEKRIVMNCNCCLKERKNVLLLAERKR